MILKAEAILESKGLKRYEISAFAKPGFYSGTIQVTGLEDLF